MWSDEGGVAASRDAIEDLRGLGAVACSVASRSRGPDGTAAAARGAELAGRRCHDAGKEPRVPRRRKLLLAALIAYLAMPFDLVPNFIPVAGQLDDVNIVALVLRAVLRAGGPLSAARALAGTTGVAQGHEPPRLWQRSIPRVTERHATARLAGLAASPTPPPRLRPPFCRAA